MTDSVEAAAVRATGRDRAGRRALDPRGQRHRAHHRPGIVDPGLPRAARRGPLIEVVPGPGKGVRGPGARPPADARLGHPSAPKRRLNKDIRAKTLRVHSARMREEPPRLQRRVNDQAISLAREWRMLGRAATAVALLTSPALFVLLYGDVRLAADLGAAGHVRRRRDLPRRRRRDRAQADPVARALRRRGGAQGAGRHVPAPRLVLAPQVQGLVLGRPDPADRPRRHRALQATRAWSTRSASIIDSIPTLPSPPASGSA